ncbi:3-oxoacyl-[acyl-carrier-protein] reductase FabG [Mycolicibacterium vanbaalenii]|uniref:3-oxoacyl-[acyl-carrier-protein] reductase FabG n=1 Tax=Mycolicibacterium vanbaalenii TaxID=110539 RepID=A0A5S9RBD6_MYCVN|nr:SDR family oxidoreductase [Mycolicibacterium vanbaalenii]CAA0137496.1 3-oxoacyl-[acyl-carrier-protein] reductase FabG [Mycolicibacterium vanbaalenii]
MTDETSALITGASRGIGLSIAKALAAQKISLTITARSREALDALVPELTALGSPRVITVACDMADPAAAATITETHRRHHDGALTVLVLNAGVGTAGRIEAFPANRLDKTIAVNFRSPFLTLQAALPLLRSGASRRPALGAKIIVVSSITGVFAEAGLAAYGASKAALLSLVDTFNAEESANGITATAIAPAYVDTDMSAWTHGTVAPEMMIPADDIAHLAAALVNMSARSVVGPVVVSRAGTSGYHA